MDKLCNIQTMEYYYSMLKKKRKRMQETWVQSLGREEPLKKGMATHSSILAWRIPWPEKPGWLQSTGSRRVRHYWATNSQKQKKKKSYQAIKHMEETLMCITNWEKPIWKSYILCDSNYTTSWKSKTMETVKRIIVVRGWGREVRGTWISGTEYFCGSETTLYDTIMIATCHYTFVQTHRIHTKSEP